MRHEWKTVNSICTVHCKLQPQQPTFFWKGNTFVKPVTGQQWIVVEDGILKKDVAITA
jgi:hypothetical protein